MLSVHLLRTSKIILKKYRDSLKFLTAHVPTNAFSTTPLLGKSNPVCLSIQTLCRMYVCIEKSSVGISSRRIGILFWKCEEFRMVTMADDIIAKEPASSCLPQVGKVDKILNSLNFSNLN